MELSSSKKREERQGRVHMEGMGHLGTTAGECYGRTKAQGKKADFRHKTSSSTWGLKFNRHCPNSTGCVTTNTTGRGNQVREEPSVPVRERRSQRARHKQEEETLRKSSPVSYHVAWPRDIVMGAGATAQHAHSPCFSPGYHVPGTVTCTTVTN